jgi:hypothetical protein
MQYEPIVLALDSFVSEGDPSLSAFIVYENVATGKRAKELCDMVTERLGPGWNMEIEMSSFESLRMPRARQIAVAAVPRANLVVFSFREGDLPFEVWAWTELWLTRPVRPTALVALVAAAAGRTGKPCAAERYLEGVARRRGLDYFSDLYVPAAGPAVEHLMSAI